MRHYSKKIFLPHWLTAALVIIALTPLSPHAADSLLDVMKDEMKREMNELATQDIPPYFMSYGVSDVYSLSISASFGALTYSNDSESRVLSVKVRVGDYQLDNTHELRGQYAFSSGGYFPVALDDNHDALRSALWQETNTQYRGATERFIKVKTNVAIKVAEEDSSADFSHETEIVNFYEPPVDISALVGDAAKWEEKVKKYSALFLENENI